MNVYPGTKSRRIDSWKDIAAYLGRDVRTVIRWEKDRGLPVHRDNSAPGRPTVYADAEELDRWLMGHSAEAEDLPNPVSDLPTAPPGRSWRRLSWVMAACCIVAALLVGALLSGAKAGRHLRFVRSDFPAYGPMSVGVADFDHDGNVDIAFTNSAADTVDILFGDGHGGFPRRASISNPAQPERLAIADFNKDGNPDLAVTHRGSRDLIVLLGDGRGAFRESFHWDTSGRSRWVTAADLNADGILDLVVACSLAQKVAVLLGRGDGTFDRVREYGTDGEPSAAVVGDFTNDKIPDIVVTDYQVSGGKTISLYAGHGDGTFEERRPFPTGPGPLAPAVADFNHDGLADVVTADFRSGFSMLLSNGGGFSPPLSVRVDSAPGFVAPADFDLDGHMDVLLVAEHSNDAHLFYGNGRGGFPSKQVFSTAAYPDSIAIADFDKDGRPDFALGATYGNLISVYLNRAR